MATEADCLFCKIVRKEIPANEVLRDEWIVAFHDINPVAPVHVLLIPTAHATHLSDFVAQGDGKTAARLLEAAAALGTKLAPEGYRIVANEGPQGGQTVHHLHVHVLGGRQMTWPPG